MKINYSVAYKKSEILPYVRHYYPMILVCRKFDLLSGLYIYKQEFLWFFFSLMTSHSKVQLVTLSHPKKREGQQLHK